MAQFEKRSEAGNYYVGQHLWFFGGKYDVQWGMPGVHVPLTEGEIMAFDHNGIADIAYISTKTGRPLKSKYLNWGHNYSVRNGFNRGNEIKIFENEDEAIEAYRFYMIEKRNEIHDIIEQKTAKYTKWLEELEAPLRG